VRWRDEPARVDDVMCPDSEHRRSEFEARERITDRQGLERVSSDQGRGERWEGESDRMGGVEADLVHEIHHKHKDEALRAMGPMCESETMRSDGRELEELGAEWGEVDEEGEDEPILMGSKQ